MTLDSNKVLVTGGGGFLGYAVVNLLTTAQRSVRSFSRHHYPLLGHLGVEQHQGDIRDSAAVARACEGVDAVYHVAAMPGIWGSYDEYYAVNTRGTQNVIDACISRNVGLLVYTSSPSVVFDGSDMAGIDERVGYPRRYLSPYPQTKALAEQAVVSAARKRALSAIVLRPHLIWGPGDNHLVPRIVSRAKRLVQVGDGTNLVDTVYIDNAAEAHLLAERALRSDPSLSGKVYFISQDEPVPLWSIVNAILKAAGKPAVKKTISAAAARRLGTLCETAYRWLPIRGEPPMTRFLAEELATSHWFDISAAKKDLGYKPRVSIAEGLERLSDWLRNNPIQY